VTDAALTIEWVRTADRLHALEPAWWALWHRSTAATPFQSPAWLLPWWASFHPGELRTVAIWRGSDLVALAPIYLEDGPYGRRLLPIGIGVSDYLDVLIDPEVGGVGEALLGALAGEPGWDSLELEEMGEGAAGSSLPCPPRWTDRVSAQSACPGLTLSGGVDADGLPLELSPKRRQNVRRSLRAAEARGPVTVEQPGSEDFLSALVILHNARWQSRGESGVLADERVSAFQNEATTALATAGLARFFTLRIAGQLAAAYYGLLWRDRAAFYLSGFDPAFEYESPLTVLIGHGMRDAVQRGATDFSFLRGQEGYKYLWGATDRWNRRRSFRPVAQ